VNIGILSGTFHPEVGGPPTYLHALLPDLIGRGHAVRVVCYGDASPHDYGYPVTRISRRAAVPLRLARYMRAALALAAWCDVLYVQGYVFPLLLLKPLFRKRTVTKVVGDFSWEYARRHRLTELDVTAFQSEPHPFKLRLLRAIYHAALRLSDAVIAPSDHIAGLVRAWGVPAGRVHVIHNAIPESDLRHTDRAALRRELGLPLDGPLLAWVGRLIDIKGPEVAVGALAHLPDATLVMVGEGGLRAGLEAQAAAFPGRVIFTGAQDHDRVLRIMRAADVFVLSSYTEGLSHVLLESLAVGTPAVATRVGGNPEVLTDEVNGLLVPPGSSAALAAAVERLLTNAELNRRLTERALRRAADFSWSATVARTEMILQGHKVHS
jgi:glycosyltransferase involved in cell wall biosynthesis